MGPGRDTPRSPLLRPVKSASSLAPSSESASNCSARRRRVAEIKGTPGGGLAADGNTAVGWSPLAVNDEAVGSAIGVVVAGGGGAIEIGGGRTCDARGEIGSCRPGAGLDLEEVRESETAANVLRVVMVPPAVDVTT